MLRPTSRFISLPPTHAVSSPAHDPRYSGLGDIKFGAKDRFLQETDSRPMIGIFPIVVTHTEDADSYIDGAQIKPILEDIADNLCNPDTYYEQGGDMVRVGGLTYSIDLNASISKRIDDLRVGGNATIHRDVRCAATGFA